MLLPLFKPIEMAARTLGSISNGLCRKELIESTPDTTIPDLATAHIVSGEKRFAQFMQEMWSYRSLASTGKRVRLAGNDL